MDEKDAEMTSLLPTPELPQEAWGALKKAESRPDVDKSYPEFSAQSWADGYWEVYHDDDCDGVITPYPENLCLKCGMHPDLQSRGARKTNKKPSPAYLKELDGEDYSAPEPDYVASDIPHVIPKENTEIRLARLETAFAALLDRIDKYNVRAAHRI